MMFSRSFLTASALLFSTTTRSLVEAQCSNTDSGRCDFEPFNPVSCGAPDFNCGYSNHCLAQENGYDPVADCCQAPPPSACIQNIDPHICGGKCEYTNLCIANLAGYTDAQCVPSPPTCPVVTADCSQAPANPYKCGEGYTCQYDTICAAESVGFNLQADCCQDVRGNTACGTIFAPVSCGPPGGKQCPYSTQCEANSAGYNDRQCCPSVPEGTPVPAVYAPVSCGDIPCMYGSQAEATAAGFTSDECCAIPSSDVPCTAEFSPVECGPAKCGYPSQCVANAAGHAPEKCCAQPQDTEAACTMENAPVVCGQINCQYANPCMAGLAGFDANSCVKVPGNLQTTADDESSASCKSLGAIGAIAAMLL